MTDQDKIARLTAALNEPEGKYTHDQIRAKLGELQTRGRPAGPPEVRRLSEPEKQAMTHQPGEGVSDPNIHDFDAPSAQDRRLASFNERIAGLGRGVKAMGSLAIDEARAAATKKPWEEAYPNREARLRQVVRGLDDPIALGYATKAADAARAAMGGGRPYAETAARDQELFPNERTGAGILGSFSPGATTAAIRTVAPVARLLPGGPIVRSLAAYEATAPALAAGHAESSGRRLQAAGEAARDPVGLSLAGGFGAASAAGGAAARAMRARNPDLQVLHEAGLEPGPIPGRPVIRENLPLRSQLPGMSQPPLVGRATPATRTSAGRMAADVIEPDITARKTASNQRFGQLQAEVYAAEGQNPAPFEHIVQDIDTRLANQRLPDATRKALTDVRAKFQPYMESDINPELGAMRQALQGASPQQRARLQGIIDQLEAQTPKARPFTAQDLDEIRDYADSKVRTGEIKPGDVQFIQLSENMRNTLAAPGVGPGIARLNALQSEIKTGFDKRRDLLGMEEYQRGPGEDVREAMARRASEAGEETKAAGARTSAEGHAATRAGEMGPPPVLPGTEVSSPPDYKALLNVPRLQLAQERLQLNPGTIFSGAGGGNVGFFGAAGRAATRTPQRLIYPLARRMGDAEFQRTPVAVDQLTRIARDRGKKKKRKEEATAP